MNKIALLLTGILLATYVTVRFTEPADQRPAISWDSGKRVGEFCNRYRCFKQTLDEALDELDADTVSLDEARDRVLSAARQFWPEYLAYLANAEPGATEEERVAQNLVGHLHALLETHPRLAPRVAALQADLQRLHP